MVDINQLEPPPNVLDDRHATEVLRVWAGTDRLLLTLHTGWEDPGAWGLVLADIARHVASAYASDGRWDSSEVASRIRQAFLAEWDEPTTDVEQVRPQ